MASAGGDELIGWHINRGWAQQADFFPASQSGGKYKRPDIVRLELRTRDETEAMRHANRTPTMKEVAALSTRSGSSVQVRCCPDWLSMAPNEAIKPATGFRVSDSEDRARAQRTRRFHGPALMVCLPDQRSPY